VAEPTRDRDPTLDVLRGFALFGVLLANLYMLYSMRFTAPHVRPDNLPDHAAEIFIRYVVAGRAQTMLTLLFGFGFAAQLLRVEARGERILPLYVRRILALFVIGWLHNIVLAWIDVTWGYALVAPLLLVFLRASNRTRFVVAVVCCLGVEVMDAFPQYPFAEPREVYVVQFAAAVHAGDWLAIARENAVLGFVWGFAAWAWYFPWLLGRFLIGYIVGAQQWFVGPRIDVFRKLLVVGLAITLPALVALTFLPYRRAGYEVVRGIVHEVCLFAQVGVYVSAVVLLMQRAAWRRVLGILAPVGRMPLTTYMMQSAICPVFFYGWGLGWATPRPVVCIAMGCAIFVVQIAFAHLWLRFFQFGPSEWVWRTVVYWRAQPMRR
jgi:uncharacterized protein